MARLRLLLLLVLLGMVQAAEGYLVTLDGKPWHASWVQLGDGPHPGAGDLLWIRGWRIQVDGPGSYAFTTDGETLRLSRDGAPAQLVAATIGAQWKDGNQVLANPLAGRPAAELASLRCLRFTTSLIDRQAIWTADLLAPDALDWTHLLIDIRMELGERAVPLPPLAAQRIRMLAAESGSAGGGYSFDLASLATGGVLEYAELEAGGAAPVDGAWLATHPRLRHLTIRGGTISSPDRLADLHELRHLSLGWLHQELDASFASSLQRLESAELLACGVASLDPFIGLPRLESLDASASAIARLPARNSPALQRIELVGTRLGAAEVAAFAACNPQTRIRHRWLDGLREMAAKADSLTLRTGGTCHRRKSSERILHRTTDRDAIALLVAGIEIDEPASGNSCMCCGSCSLEFRSGDELLATLGMHHGIGLRWSGRDDPWPGDARLTPGAAEMLCAWLAEHGDDGPLRELAACTQQEAAARRMQENYRTILGEAACARLDGLEQPAAIKVILAERWPDPNKRTLGMLHLYGSGRRSWSGLYGLDRLLEDDDGLQLAAVEAVAQAAMTQPETCDGLARWCFALGHLDQLTPELRTAIGPALAARALADPRAENRRTTLIRLDACQEGWATQALRAALAGVNPRPLAAVEHTEPGGMVVHRPRPWSPPEEASDRAVAALALARRGSQVDADGIRALSQEDAAGDRPALAEALRLLDAAKR